MKSLCIALLAASGALVVSATASSAEVVCNEEGDCWRTSARYDYRPEFRLTVRPDGWKWDDADAGKYRWREGREGRGYWNKGVWVDFE